MECVDPNAKIEKCANCGTNVYTCERTEPVGNDYRCPVHKDGFEVPGGKWFCSSNCYKIQKSQGRLI